MKSTWDRAGKILITLLLFFIVTATHLNIAPNKTHAKTAPIIKPETYTEHYAAPTGSPAGDGTINNPWDLQTAFNQTDTIEPGDTLWLRGGVYGTGGSTLFYTKLVGTQQNPILIREYPGERATINGGIVADSSTGTNSYTSAYNWFWGFEITNTSTSRNVVPTERSAGLNLLTTGHKAINLVINNTGHPGIGFWRPVEDGEIYGTIFWGNGISDISYTPPVFRGSPIYAQNMTGTKLIEDNISFRNYTTGMKAYTESSYINGITFRGNILFDSPEWLLLVASIQNPAQNIVLEENLTYRSKYDTRANIQNGYPFEDHEIESLAIENNYFVGGKSDSYVLSNKLVKNLTNTNNTIIGNKDLIQYKAHPQILNMTWNNNSYIGGTYNRYPFELNGTAKSFSEWKSSTGFDSDSSYSDEYPYEQKVFIKPNKYDPGRYTIVVYNWNMFSTVKINLATTLETGVPFEIRDAQNFYGKPIIKSIYTGGEVEIPLFLYDVAPIIGNVTHITNKHTLAEFNTFILLTDTSGNFQQQVDPPIIAPFGSLFETSINVTMRTNTPQATIRYTLDGSEPTATSTIYQNPLDLTETKTIKVKAFRNGYEPSITMVSKVIKIDRTSGLQGHWKFDETSGTTAIDTKGLIGNGTIYGNPTRIEGRKGKALHFDGVDDYVSIGTTHQNSAYTISFWAKAEQNGVSGVVVGNIGAETNSSNYMMYINTAQNTNNYAAVSSYSNTNLAVENKSSDCKNMYKWNHYAGVFDGSNLQLYCNGRLVNTKAFTGPAAPNSNNVLAFARKGAQATNYFKGALDEVKIYNRALGKMEIAKLAEEFTVPDENIFTGGESMSFPFPIN